MSNQSNTLGEHGQTLFDELSSGDCPVTLAPIIYPDPAGRVTKAAEALVRPVKVPRPNLGEAFQELSDCKQNAKVFAPYYATLRNHAVSNAREECGLAPSARVAINSMDGIFDDASWPEFLETLLTETESYRLTLELVERGQVPDEVFPSLVQLTSAGWHLSLDDLGQGEHDLDEERALDYIGRMYRAGITFHEVKVARELLAEYDPNIPGFKSLLEANRNRIASNLSKFFSIHRSSGSNIPIVVVFEDWREEEEWLAMARELAYAENVRHEFIWFQTA